MEPAGKKKKKEEEKKRKKEKKKEKKRKKASKKKKKKKMLQRFAGLDQEIGRVSVRGSCRVVCLIVSVKSGSHRFLYFLLQVHRLKSTERNIELKRKRFILWKSRGEG